MRRCTPIAAAVVEQCAGDVPTDSCVDDPRLRQLIHPACDLEDDRHGAQSLGKSSRTRRLLADAPARKRYRLIGEPRFLPANTNLDEHVVRALDGAIEVARDDERAGVPLAIEHPCRDALAAYLRAKGVQNELGDVEARKPGTSSGV